MKKPPSAADRFKILDHVPTGICIVQNDFLVLFWNACLENWTGIPKDEIVGTDLTTHYPHLKEAKYESRIETITHGGPPAIFSSQLHENLFPPVHATGRNRIQHTTVSSVPALDGNSFYALFAVEDVTELTSRIKDYRVMRDQAVEEVRQRKITEHELRKANRKIQEQQKAVIQEERLKVLLQMAGATAHELNQPLMSLLGNLELFELAKKQPEKLESYLGKIKQASQRISETVRKIQTIRYDEIVPHDGKTTIINIDQKLKILCAEDSDEDYDRIVDVLRDSKLAKITRSKSVERTLHLLNRDKYDLVLSDYLLEDGTCRDLLLKINHLETSPPIVVITGKGDEMVASQMLQTGAYDYLPKDRLNKASLLRVIKNALEKAELKNEIRKAQAKMAEMTTIDDLTQLYNRRYFNDALAMEYERTLRYKTGLVLVLLDLDHFKKINDTYGHPEGDRLLANIGGILKQLSRKNDMACRYGGEEFALLLPSTGLQDARSVCEKLRKSISEERFGSENTPIRITVSMGLASAEETQNSDQLLENADKALYEAKTSGRNKTVIYPFRNQSPKKPAAGA